MLSGMEERKSKYFKSTDLSQMLALKQGIQGFSRNKTGTRSDASQDYGTGINENE